MSSDEDSYDAFVGDVWLEDPGKFAAFYGLDSSSDDQMWVPQNIRADRVRTRGANSYTPNDRLNSTFYRTYVQPIKDDPTTVTGLRDDTSRLGKRFRRRFAVPYSMFEAIVSEISLQHTTKPNAAGSRPIEIELLVLGSLRILSSGCTFDMVEELTCVSADSQRNFFKNAFCNSWGRAKANDVINLPSTEQELRHVMGYYERKGAPGCTGSVDCVHVVWDGCPAGLLSSCKGKEKVPTLVFQVVASHTRKILAVSNVFYGCFNDKSISRRDLAIVVVRDKNTFLDSHIWTCYNIRGDVKENKGLYFICDGGYHAWPCMIPPYKHQVEGTDLHAWSSSIESLRKDIECVFGILKKRFLFLKYPIRLQMDIEIESVFLTCCAIHNLLMDYDGIDEWEAKYLDDDDDNEDEFDVLNEAGRILSSRSVNSIIQGCFTRSQY